MLGQTALDSDVIVNMTSPTSDVMTASVTSSCGDVIGPVRHHHLNQSADDVTVAPTKPTDDEETGAAADEADQLDDADDDDDDDDEFDSPTEQRLMRQLLRRYETAVRPVRNATETVTVRMGLTLTQIFNMVSHTHFSHSPFTCNQ